ncbi:ABC transporter ATP-binding protein [Streptomyces sp. NPDC087440]|uniref:ABC transporter ATP-binding protein n=1 Tax=Streptomyces sp. NPDC087440 TaxID=3365790 RepID=UPI00380ED750
MSGAREEDTAKAADGAHPASAADSSDALPEQEPADTSGALPEQELTVESRHWDAFDSEVRATGYLTMVRRLPWLIGHGLRLSWQASRRDTAAALIAGVSAAVLTSFGLLATNGALESLLTGGPTRERVQEAVPSLVWLAVIITVRGALQLAVDWLQQRLVPQVEQTALLSLFAVVGRVDLVALDDPDFHDQVQRAQERGAGSTGRMVGVTLSIATALFGMVAVAGTLALLHPVLVPLVLLAALPPAWASVRSARESYGMYSSVAALYRREQVVRQLLADREPAAELRAFGMRDFLMREFRGVQQAVCDRLLQLAGKQIRFQGQGQALGGIATFAIYLALGLLLVSGRIPFAAAGTALVAVRTAQQILTGLTHSVNTAYEDGLYVSDFLALRDDIAPRRITNGTRTLPASFTHVTARDVTFTYPAADSPAVQGVDLDLRRGEVVALVGENGSGKTTLAKIIAGLYLPDAGEVRYDGISTAEADRDGLPSLVAPVPQAFVRWPLTVRDNITLGAPGDEARVRGAASEAGADGFIETLPRGYDTLLDRSFKEGRDLSGGQWQRLAIARGFYRDTPLLICDEPTSALDARAEHALFERIKALAHGRTVLLITHRLASVRMADRIYVLEQGRLHEHGTHTELMARHGLYHELYTLQASAYRSD